jgi:hypothetical protein
LILVRLVAARSDASLFALVGAQNSPLPRRCLKTHSSQQCALHRWRGGDL